MLDWLNNLGKKPDHPMHNIEEADRLLSGLSEEPLKAIEEVTSWLTTLTSATGFDLTTHIDVIKLVDETGRPFEPALNQIFLTSLTLTEFERLRHWQTALQFWERLADAYRLCFDELQRNPKLLRAHPDLLLLLIVRMMRAHVSHAKVLRLRYVAVDERLWKTLFDLYKMSEEAGCDNQQIRSYADDTAATTARQELLRALMLDAVAPESMPPAQIELAARIVARYVDACLFKPTPGAGCNWYVDLAQPRRPEHATGVTALQPTMRFFGAGIVIVKIGEVIRRLSSEPGAKEQRFGEDYSSPQKLVVLNRLSRFWGEHPPYRREPRRQFEAEITVVRGFKNACRIVPRTTFRGWADFVLTMDPRLKEKLGFDPAVEAPEIPTERWLGSDASNRGVRAFIPRTSESWVKLGALCAVRSGNQSWSIGVVRGLSRDSADRLRAGIELVGMESSSLWLRNVGHGGLRVDHRANADSSVYDFINAIPLDVGVAAARTCELLLARGDFVPGVIFEAMADDRRPHLRLEELLEQGDDFDRTRCSMIARE
jgi:hypothetical protein